MTRKPVYLLREAACNLHAINMRSREKWGAFTAEKYITNIYRAINEISENTQAGKLRSRRSAPFSMIPVAKHFIVYDFFQDTIFIVAIIHQARDIEAIISTQTQSFLEEIETLRARVNHSRNCDLPITR